ncbi:hypothetical protein IX332_001307 [Porphyromonas levii]|uniref:Omp28-related outer membrane protein n=1 Tax=Porphyromonas levii TaxID=28114 RepID=UPI001B8D5D84|nr:Omp28-related outer membrane protein [Porphyromonas levii]MBR8729978.1 hypothetical protein [Porphyromonas levii]
MRFLNSIWAFVVLSILLGGVLWGCAQKVDSKDRWVPKEEEKEELPQQRKTILVEEYTGQLCINCPTAAKILQEVSKKYAPNVITVEMHAKRTKQTEATLESALADKCAEKFAIPSVVPGVMINRLPIGSAKERYSDDRSAWTALTQKILEQKATHQIEVKIGAVKGREVTFTIRGTKLSSQDKGEKVGLAVWVVEDIYALQKVGNKVEPKFLHHNVLRDALTTEVDYQLGETRSVTTELPQSVKEVKNAKVIAFLYNKATDEIYEAAIAPLGSGITSNDTETEKEEKPEPKETEIKFYLGDKPVVSGSELKATVGKKLDNGIVELESPVVTVAGLKEEQLKGIVLDVFAEKMDHKDDTNSGIVSICLDNCSALTGLQQQYHNPKYTPHEKDNITLHFGLKNPAKKDTYRVRMCIKNKEKEVAHWIYVFEYDPTSVKEDIPSVTPPEEKPTPPEEQPIPDNPPAPTPPTGGNAKSNVVAVDFTGQRCPACISRLRDLNDYSKELHPNLILVSIHSYGYYTVNEELIPRGDIINPYYKHCGVPYFPSIYVNNVPITYNGGYATREEVNKKPTLSSSLKVELLDGKRVKVSCKSQPYDEASKAILPTKMNVLFWVVQNKMRGFQAGVSTDYEHNHILRGTLNGAWGESYTLGINHSKVYDLPPVDEWYPPQNLTPSNRFNLENCEVIAIFLDADTKRFYDAVKVSLKK